MSGLQEDIHTLLHSLRDPLNNFYNFRSLTHVITINSVAKRNCEVTYYASDKNPINFPCQLQTVNLFVNSNYYNYSIVTYYYVET